MTKIDAYIAAEMVKAKNSKSMNSLCAATLKNSKFVDVISHGKGGVAGCRFPKNFSVVVHSAGGDPEKKNLKDYSVSLVDRLVAQARAIGAVPVAFADVIDGSSPDGFDLSAISEPLVSRASDYNLAVLNGESAWLGSRVNCMANLSGTMISLLKKDEGFVYPHLMRGYPEEDDYVVFDHEGKFVWINSDGIGTKTEFYERAKKYELGVLDFMAMTMDDSSKLAAVVKVISGVLETKGRIPVAKVQKFIDEKARRFGALGILQHEHVADRIMGFNSRAPSYNISGSVVSLVDEERLKSPPTPKAGDSLIAIRGVPNPRSNGITDKRKAMVEMLGKNWHKTKEGLYYLDFLAEPSTVFYSLFKKLLEKGAASSVYHMSGGAYKNKLAAVLAEQNLYALVKKLFPADPREVALAGDTPNEIAYAKWPMGNEGFVTSSRPHQALDIIRSFGLEAKVVAQLNVAENGTTGVKFAHVKDSTGNLLYYSGREAA